MDWLFSDAQEPGLHSRFYPPASTHIAPRLCKYHNDLSHHHNVTILTVWSAVFLFIPSVILQVHLKFLTFACILRLNVIQHSPYTATPDFINTIFSNTVDQTHRLIMQDRTSTTYKTPIDSTDKWVMYYHSLIDNLPHGNPCLRCSEKWKWNFGQPLA
jgi:hypothetical protein